MKYCHYVTLKDGHRCVIRNAEPTDAQEVLDVMQRAHVQTDFLRSYPNEMAIDVEQGGVGFRRGLSLSAKSNSSVSSMVSSLDLRVSRRWERRAKYGIELSWASV